MNPLSNLDAALRVELRDEIRRLQRLTGVTTLFVTHDQTDALRIADRIVVLANGQIQQVGTGEQLYQHPHTQFVAEFIGTPRLNRVPYATAAPFLTIPENPGHPTARTLGIRSEALTFAPAAATPQPILAQLTATVTRQVVIGRDRQTNLATPWGSLLSTTLPAMPAGQPVQLAVTARGSFLFDTAGHCIWDGDRDA